MNLLSTISSVVSKRQNEISKNFDLLFTLPAESKIEKTYRYSKNIAGSLLDPISYWVLCPIIDKLNYNRFTSYSILVLKLLSIVCSMLIAYQSIDQLIQNIKIKPSTTMSSSLLKENSQTPTLSDPVKYTNFNLFKRVIVIPFLNNPSIYFITKILNGEIGKERLL